MDTLHETIAAQLTHIGFTQLESETYLFLLTNGANTGYAVAKGIGKAVANVYKAIESLSSKGAVEQSVSNNKLCVAIDWKLVINAEQKKFDNLISKLSENLADIPKQQTDENVYQMQNVDLLYQHTEQIINQSKHLVLADLDPLAATQLAPTLIAAAERGVEVRVKVYQAISLPNVHITLRDRGKEIQEKTVDNSFHLNADGKQTTIALLTQDDSEVIQAFKTQSPLINMVLYNALIHELILTDLKKLVRQKDLDACQQLLEKTEHLNPFSAENTVFEHYKKQYEFQREKGNNHEKA